MAQKLGYRLVNVNLQLSKRMLELTRTQRSRPPWTFAGGRSKRLSPKNHQLFLAEYRNGGQDLNRSCITTPKVRCRFISETARYGDLYGRSVLIS
jgi:hypothetical protein